MQTEFFKRIVRVFKLIKFIDEKHIIFNPSRGLKKCKQSGVDCCGEDCWAKIELLSSKN